VLAHDCALSVSVCVVSISVSVCACVRARVMGLPRLCARACACSHTVLRVCVVCAICLCLCRYLYFSPSFSWAHGRFIEVAVYITIFRDSYFLAQLPHSFYLVICRCYIHSRTLYRCRIQSPASIALEKVHKNARNEENECHACVRGPEAAHIH